MNCPACQIALNITDRQGVEIDYCPQCRGIWLDRGELDKIIERSAGAYPSPPTPQPDYQRQDSYQRTPPPPQGYHQTHKKKKYKSFLDEIFDFD